jgi:hypothetical protein
VSVTSPASDILDSVSNPRQPFGLPLGSVRGILSLFICGFFWLVLLWPEQPKVKPLLAHFFMLALVLLVFSPYAKGTIDTGSRLLPRLLRWLFVGGTVAVVAYVGFYYPERLGGGPNGRITPDPVEFQEWWGPFLAATFLAFLGGQGLRFLMGEANPIFQTLRAWLSIVGMLMLGTDIVVWVLSASSQNPDPLVGFLRYWQAFELAVVSAYFGTRA